MATVAWKNHSNGALNPKAMYRKEVTKEAIFRSPMVCEPYISVMDCSGVSDGCACAILTASENAKYYRPDPMYVKCTEIAAASGFGTFSTEYDYTTVKETVHCAQNAYRKAGITDPAKQLSLMELHDCFAITEIVLYEDLMLSERGRGWRDCLEGKFLRSGQTPVNVDGGLKSFGHPVGASGIRMLYVDGAKVGINIFPHRGTDEWNNWGWTIPEKLDLTAGKHTFTLKFESDADNMDLEINDFKIKSLRLKKL